ncbi:menaquinone biosynthesis protein [Paenibacillus beijingensis]|uniref:Chorismate dehydratase n=1 Tax=Paenibacillus beijingensis TaxID=1126833 RepID=A0A0D5NPU3_9BACL|nr:menaquinone biosynthesis protein [Paenibacillus beijingensis]AJY77170.1 ABC transporter substrate-binding protein [Paenibacillus beijingensis]
MSANHRIAIGRIDYANAWPLYHYVQDRTPQYEVVYRVPAELNRMLREGGLDMSTVSSFAYGANADEYVLLPDLSVSSEGPVQSILLFMKKPLEDVLKGTIALTATSATSVNLLKILMSLHLKGNPAYITGEPDLETMLRSADAALLIGDSAIRASWSNRELQVLDLGRLWQEWTGLGMTYAVAAVRKESAQRNPEAVDAVYRSMLASKLRSLRNLKPLIHKGVSFIGGDEMYWRGYFSGLKYDFDSGRQAGLELYFRYARRLGLLEREVKLEFFRPTQTAEQVNE